MLCQATSLCQVFHSITHSLQPSNKTIIFNGEHHCCNSTYRRLLYIAVSKEYLTDAHIIWINSLSAIISKIFVKINIFQYVNFSRSYARKQRWCLFVSTVYISITQNTAALVLTLHVRGEHKQGVTERSGTRTHFTHEGRTQARCLKTGIFILALSQYVSSYRWTHKCGGRGGRGREVGKGNKEIYHEVTNQ